MSDPKRGEQDVTTATIAINVLSSPDTQVLEKGTLVGEYTVGRVLGAGGCARVYEARHTSTGNRVALKVLNAELAARVDMVQRFIREAQMVNRIHHPHVAEIYEFGVFADGRPYFFMEYIEGRSLSAELLVRGRLPLAEAAIMLEQLASALDAAHHAGVVHRDVKGSNIMLVQGQAKLLDFGIAKLLHPEPSELSLTTKNHALGSPPYMSPEQILGEAVDGRADVYSLGVVAFFAVTGALPFWAEQPLDLMHMHLDVAAPAPSSLVPVSAAIDAAVLCALAKDPRDRFASPGEFSRSFREAVTASAGGS